VVFVCPILFMSVGALQHFTRLSLLSPLVLTGRLLANLLIRIEQYPHLVWWATCYDLAVALLAAALLVLATKMLDLNLANDVFATAPSKTAGKEEPSAIERTFAGD
jgi:hypothetical protein